MKRRIVSAALLLLLEVITSSATICNMTNPCKYLGQGSEYLKEPQQLRSSKSCWETTFKVEIGTITYNWLTLYRRLYNKKRAGPTISVKRGDQFTLHLNNTLSPVGNHNGNGMNEQRFPNSTNMHTHGLHISSEYGQDDVLMEIAPEHSFSYRYKIHEHNSPGTYWYHAHVHGSTGFQVNGGMSGILIVEDRLKDMSRELISASCPLNCRNDIQLLFQPILMFGGRRGYEKYQEEIHDYKGFRNDQYKISANETLTHWLTKNVKYVTTNGQLQPKLVMRTGQIHRFRMANAGGTPNLEVYITENDITVPTPKCEIREIALDAVYLPEPRRMYTGQSLIVPGGRVDWLVICHCPGIYQLASYHNPINKHSMGSADTYDNILVTLKVQGIDARSTFPTTLPATFHKDLRKAKAEEGFVIDMGALININRMKLSHPFKYKYNMTLGKVQEWTILNPDTEIAHPLHIHVNHFQIISYNNYTGGYRMTNDDTWYLNDINDIYKNCYYQHPGYTPDNKTHKPEPDYYPFKYLGHNERYNDVDDSIGYARIGDWKDTVLVPPLVNITVRFVPIDYTGNVVIHCHILQHEDEGMMMVVGITDENGGTIDVDMRAGNAYPGTCRKCDRFPPFNATNLCGQTDYGTPTRYPWYLWNPWYYIG